MKMTPRSRFGRGVCEPGYLTGLFFPLGTQARPRRPAGGEPGARARLARRAAVAICLGIAMPIATTLMPGRRAGVWTKAARAGPRGSPCGRSAWTCGPRRHNRDPPLTTAPMHNCRPASTRAPRHDYPDHAHAALGTAHARSAPDRVPVGRGVGAVAERPPGRGRGVAEDRQADGADQHAQLPGGARGRAVLRLDRRAEGGDRRALLAPAVHAARPAQQVVEDQP